MEEKKFIMIDGVEVEVTFDDEVLEKNKINEFIISSSPGSWLEYAENLMDCAGLLWQKAGMMTFITEKDPIIYKKGDRNKKISKTRSSSQYKTFGLLSGLAIENVLKGLLILEDKDRILEGKIKEIKSHRLTYLIEKLKENPLEEEEMKILKIIETCIPYWGRYPIPISYDQLLEDYVITESDYLSIKVIFNKLSKKLYFQFRDGWQPKEGMKSTYRSKRYEDSLD